MKQWLLFTLLFLMAYPSFAQGYDPAKVNKKVRELFDKSYELATNDRYKEAIAELDKAISQDNRFVEGYLARAGVYSRLRMYAQAVKDYESADAIDKKFASIQALQYSVALAGMGRFEDAMQVAVNYISTPNLSERSRQSAKARMDQYSFAIDYAKHYPNAAKLDPISMGDKINSRHLEYYPSFTIDKSRIIFTRREGMNEDFFESEWKEGNWLAASRMSDRINTPANEGAQNLSIDGSMLVYAGCDYPMGEGSCDLYSSEFINGEWTSPKNLGRNINTEYWESAPSLSPDKTELYFVSNRPGGYGGKDIYVSRKDSAGRWQRPQNMGAVINTKGDDESPFLHADNSTLYFTSSGHPGYGNRDIYLTRRSDTGWTKPFNLGYPVNTIDDEGALVVSPDGKTAYYASDAGEGANGLDLFTFTLSPQSRAMATTWAKGKVVNKKTGEPLNASIELSGIDSNAIQQRFRSDDAGSYTIALPEAKRYAFNVYKKGFLFYSENIFIPETAGDTARVMDIQLSPIEKGATLVMRNVFFETNKWDLQPASVYELSNLILLLKDNPTAKINIKGFTDNVGKPQDNLALSEKRAKAVKDYLVQNGIGAARLSSKGFGEKQPVADNNTEAGKALNRRTEIELIAL